MSSIRVLRFLPFLLVVFPALAADPQPPQTVAEATDYKATSKYADVVSFCEQLAKSATRVVRLGNLGSSGEGRKIPLIILADPPVATPEESRKSGKLVVLAHGNIHAGEVDGKEALMMLAREIAFANERSLLKDLIVVIAPNFNPDGNERFGKNRPWQGGPDEVGIRENAGGYDLNRDFIRLATPEVQALVAFYRHWNPALVIDCHTTDGSLHRYTLTYDGPHHPATSEPLAGFVRDVMLPDAGKRLEKATGFHSFFYGNFRKNHTEWEGFPPIVRVGIHYAGLRGRIGILSESYVYASFRDRVAASREFTRACIEFVAENKAKVEKLLADAEKPMETVPLRHKFMARAKQATALGFEEELKDGKRVAGKPKDYTVTHFDLAEPALRVPRPAAYLIPASLTKVIENLQRHGIALEELSKDSELECHTYTIQKIKQAERPNRSRPTVELDVARRADKAMSFPAGTIVVRTNQPLGNLATFLLEPQAEDGLAAWGFLDGQLAEGKAYPISAIMTDASLPTRRVPPLP